MPLSESQLNRATLARQMLLHREKVGVVDAVHRVTALQAQEPASPYLALWNRIQHFDPADLDAAFESHAVVKASLMRITLHAVDAADYPAFHTAMVGSLRVSRLNDARFARTGLSAEAADAEAARALRYAARPRTNAEMQAHLDTSLGPLPEPGLWWALRTYLPLVHAPTGGPWSFGRRPAYLATPHRPSRANHARCVQHLARRYLEAFGPAGVADLAKFTLLSRMDVRDAFTGLGDEVEAVEGPGGTRLYDLAGASVPDGDVLAPPHLLGMWDSVLLAYADRSRLIPAEYRGHVIRRNGDVLPTVLVDGFVAGVWRPVDDGIEVTAFRRLTDADWAGIADEADALRAFLADREPAVYSRYRNWWATLPGVEIRVLP